jgi:hypothetical protein
MNLPTRVSSFASVAAGLLFPAMVGVAENPEKAEYQDDPRRVAIERFFADRDCPLQELAADFLEAADRNGLDWRLLPSLSFVESGGGKDYTNNNVFGWANCNQKFPSVRDGIHYVAGRLSQSGLYRDKSLEDILRTYNPVGDYPSRVKRVMQQIERSGA